MSSIRSENTKPEIVLRKALWAKGFRYRKQYGKQKIDIAFPSKKIAIFVDGCFWHGCPVHSHIPKSNQAYWKPKLEKNKHRDKLMTETLQDQGWTVMRVWEHEVKNTTIVVEQIEKAINSPRTGIIHH
jgi:DNA mismatch endonuclease, patch repair protein